MTIDSAARIQLYARIEIQGVSGHPGRKAYPGQDRITWSGYNPPVSKVVVYPRLGKINGSQNTRLGY